MFAILLIGLAAGCAAAPNYPDDGNKYLHYRQRRSDNWRILDMRKLDDSLNSFNKHVYQISIELKGFDAKEVEVKVGGREVAVHAFQGLEGGMRKTVTRYESLPLDVDESGSWMLENNMLVITFPFKNSVVDSQVVPQTPTSNAPVTEHQNHDIIEVSHDRIYIRR